MSELIEMYKDAILQSAGITAVTAMVVTAIVTYRVVVINLIAAILYK